MVGEPDNDLRGDIVGLREDIREIRIVQDRHTLHVDFLEERVETLREATLTSVGIAIESTARERRLEEMFADLTARVEKLEKAK